MGPYLTVLAINAALVAVAYAVVYPRLEPLTARRMTYADIVVTGLALGTAALLYAGRGHGFEVGPVPLRWWGFSLLSMMLIEAPVFWAFCRAKGISLRDPDLPARR